MPECGNIEKPKHGCGFGVISQDNGKPMSGALLANCQTINTKWITCRGFAPLQREAKQASGS